MNDRATFASLLARHYLRDVAEKPLLRQPFVRLSRLLTAGAFLFENGAILGRAFRDRFALFAVPFAVLPDRPDGLEFVLEQGRSVGSIEPSAGTILEVFLMHEMHLSNPLLQLSSWGEWWMGTAKEKLPVDSALAMAIYYSARGAGFGCQWPDRLADLYRAFHEKRDPVKWRLLHDAGLHIPREQEELTPIEDREGEAVSGFADFCREVWPEYARQLDFDRWVTRN